MKEYIVKECDCVNFEKAKELIRCKDCKYYEKADGYCEFIGDFDISEDFFCANGQLV